MAGEINKSLALVVAQALSTGTPYAFESEMIQQIAKDMARLPQDTLHNLILLVDLKDGRDPGWRVAKIAEMIGFSPKNGD